MIAVPTGGQETILLVEDDDHVRGAVRELLEHEGYRVCDADRGAAALEIWDREGGRIDLVLTDVVMPGMDGGRLVADLRVIFMTGHDRDVVLPGHHAGRWMVNAVVRDRSRC